MRGRRGCPLPDRTHLGLDPSGVPTMNTIGIRSHPVLSSSFCYLCLLICDRRGHALRIPRQRRFDFQRCTRGKRERGTCLRYFRCSVESMVVITRGLMSRTLGACRCSGLLLSILVGNHGLYLFLHVVSFSRISFND